MGTWKALFTSIGILSAIFLLAMIIKPPKFDAIIRWNPPSVYIPVSIIVNAILIAMLWKSLRK